MQDSVLNKIVVVACIAVAASALTILVTNPGHIIRPTDPQQVSETPDWTFAPCSLWADESDPVLPKYTILNACVADDGTLSIAPEDIQLPTIQEGN